MEWTRYAESPQTLPDMLLAPCIVELLLAGLAAKLHAIEVLIQYAVIFVLHLTVAHYAHGLVLLVYAGLAEVLVTLLTQGGIFDDHVADPADKVVIVVVDEE